MPDISISFGHNGLIRVTRQLSYFLFHSSQSAYNSCNSSGLFLSNISHQPQTTFSKAAINSSRWDEEDTISRNIIRSTTSITTTINPPQDKPNPQGFTPVFAICATIPDFSNLTPSTTVLMGRGGYNGPQSAILLQGRGGYN